MIRSLTSVAALVLLVAGCASSTPAQLAVPTAVPPTPTVVTPPPAATIAPAPTTPQATPTAEPTPAYRPGAAVLLDEQRELLAGRRIGLIANQASVVDGESIIDRLAADPDFDLVALFAPEHGVRGNLGAGEVVPGGIDDATGIVVHSLYGDQRVPTPTQLSEIDVLVYDLQDAGTRFYTFISTMGLAMQAAAEADVEVVILDRPNPQRQTRSSGFVLDPAYASFIGQYPIPAAYALTPGELARAIVGEQWLDGLADLKLSVVPLQGWQHGMGWQPVGHSWVPPSPGLATIESVLAYPGTVLFEATTAALGRCTDHPFATIGIEGIDGETLAATLEAAGRSGLAFESIPLSPCPRDSLAVPVQGLRWVITDPARFDATEVGIHVLLAAYAEDPTGLIDRPAFLDLLAGTDRLRTQTVAGATVFDIIASWQNEAAAFDQLVNIYRLYPLQSR